MDKLFLILCLSILTWLKQYSLWSSIVRFQSVSKELFLCSYTLLLVRHPKSSNENISYWGKTCCHVGGTNLFKVINECHIFFSFLVFVVFGNSFSDKHSLLWTLAPVGTKIRLQLYCDVLMSLSFQKLQNNKLIVFILQIIVQMILLMTKYNVCTHSKVLYMFC